MVDYLVTLGTASKAAEAMTRELGYQMDAAA